MSYAAVAENESAELQTDVMRFMAILAFCLVAIFAIVQSLPAPPAPPQDSDTPIEAPATIPTETRTTMSTGPQPVELLRATAVPPPAPPTPRLQRAAPAPQKPPTPVRAEIVPAVPVDAVPAAPARAISVAEPGLSLRFESDAVLRQLVQRGLVSLFAIDGNQFYALKVTGGAMDFRPQRAPSNYHEMFAETVPADIQRSAPPGTTTWGVTLPAATSRQLERFVRTNFSGGLVITADAQLALQDKGA